MRIGNFFIIDKSVKEELYFQEFLINSSSFSLKIDQIIRVEIVKIVKNPIKPESTKNFILNNFHQEYNKTNGVKNQIIILYMSLKKNHIDPLI